MKIVLPNGWKLHLVNTWRLKGNEMRTVGDAKRIKRCELLRDHGT